MKAIVCPTYGPPEVLQLTEVEKPTPKGDEVLIKIHATTVNRTDCGFLRAKPFITRFFSGFTKPKNPILGSEFAGEIKAVGRNVKSFEKGDRVFGFSDFGAHAEYITRPEDGLLAKIPEGMSYKEAAPGAEGSHYALNNIKAADIQSEQRVLINGATGAIGSAALQIIKHIGAEVTAVCNTKNIELVKSLGADKIYDYQKEDFTKGDQKYDVVFDAVGKSSFSKCKPLLKTEGIFMSTELGPYWQNPFLAMWTSKFGDKKVLFPIPKNNKEDILYLKDLMEKGAFKPIIDRSYPLDQIVEAFNYVETGQKTGNVVITLNQNNKA